MWILPHKSFIIIEELDQYKQLQLAEQKKKVSFVNNYNNDVQLTLHEYCNLIGQ